MGLFDSVIAYTDEHTGFFALLSALMLATVTIYYAIQTKKQLDLNSMRYADESQTSRKLRSNYLILLLSELELNAEYLIAILARQEFKRQGIKLQHPTKYKHSTSDSLSDSVWNSINASLVKYSSSKFIHVLAEYYVGIRLMMGIRDKTGEDVQKPICDLAEKQLILHYRCMEYMQKVLGDLIKTKEIFSVGEVELTVDRSTGKVKILNVPIQ